ncbi:Fucose permease [Nocardiopsis flavescens]|uniref:Fucose permease n=1 Tax=Nocardiopsis flavescens TaxID=758803 RepID=A0A1M6UAF9_9ACTN|nr:MFS transporter [Nocardiopsis flavescens]SHK66149.1 Fucose permease [Nocardiopsis flavescens]
MTAPDSPTAPGPAGRTPVDRQVRGARAAVSLLFLTNGALYANLVPRYPEIKAALELGNAEYGLAIAAFPAGALVAGMAAGPVIRRFRSARVAAFGTVLTALGMLAAALGPTWAALAGALLLAGAFDAIVDVAQNAHGLRVQRLYKRSVLNSFHALWSVGAVTGGLMGAAATGLGVSPGLHLAVAAVLLSAVALTAYRWTLPGPDRVEPLEEARAGAGGAGAGRAVSGAAWTKYAVLAALAVISIAGIMVEDAGSTWGAVYLSDHLGATASLAAFGYIALVGAQFVGRIAGDGLTDRFGQRAVARAGGAIAALGLGTALLFPSVPGTIAGFAAAGFGVATLIPSAMHAADELRGLKPGTGLALVSWLMRVGFLCSPPVVGAIADATSLRTGLMVVPLAGLAVVLLAGALADRSGRAPGGPRAAQAPEGASPENPTTSGAESPAR